MENAVAVTCISGSFSHVFRGAEHHCIMHADDVVMFALDDFDFDLDTELDHAPWESGMSRAASSLKHDDDVLMGAVRKLDGATCERAKAVRSAAESLAVVRGFMLSVEHRELFEPGGLLEPYLSCVRTWAIDVADAFASGDVAALHLVVWIYERALLEQARLESVIDALPNDLVAALHELFAAVPRLKRAI
jgi:hypothetical protein